MRVRVLVPALLLVAILALAACSSSAGNGGENGAEGAIPGMPKGEESSNVTDTEADEMEEHLRGLGYLE